ncbi:hypothetical protein ROZALSC1DRAFT_22296 [Rozella allomycis CSF55]|uniref:Parvovirus non-structural protein 1 helicase domain-containing protein n=1 Tax=Rozella allomycis (strain CSF55) TaxID=988480 RepID=A0A4P9YIL8_ROZAC|nr:hypothetical protein ROZALSC1DRAFT_22296 [Rozella allomycis CSF55]
MSKRCRTIRPTAYYKLLIQLQMFRLLQSQALKRNWKHDLIALIQGCNNNYEVLRGTMPDISSSKMISLIDFYAIACDHKFHDELCLFAFIQNHESSFDIQLEQLAFQLKLSMSVRVAEAISWGESRQEVSRRLQSRMEILHHLKPQEGPIETDNIYLILRTHNLDPHIFRAALLKFIFADVSNEKRRLCLIGSSNTGKSRIAQGLCDILKSATLISENTVYKLKPL